jgi:hypothetical protein
MRAGLQLHVFLIYRLFIRKFVIIYRNLKILAEEKTSFVISNVEKLNLIEKLDLVLIKTINFINDSGTVKVYSLQLTPLNIIDDK